MYQSGKENLLRIYLIDFKQIIANIQCNSQSAVVELVTEQPREHGTLIDITLQRYVYMRRLRDL